MLDLHSFRRRYRIRAETRGWPVEVGTADELALIVDEPADVLRLAFGDSGIEMDDDTAVEIQLLIGDRIADQLEAAFLGSTTEAVSLDMLVAVKDGAAGGLTIPADLAARLPLIPLAESVATRASNGRLIVELVPHGCMSPFGGLFSRYRSGWTIALDGGLPDEVLIEVWAHELGHALDQVVTGGERVDTASREELADALIEPLLKHEPRTVAEATALVEAAFRECAPRRHSAPSSNALIDVLEWALEETGVLLPQPELIAAHKNPEETR